MKPWLFIVPVFILPSSLHAEEVTFNKDIAPIIWKNCSTCHRPGEVAPFSLLTYRDVSKRAKFVAEICESRTMPPWKPEPNFGGKFHDERRLSDKEIELLKSWAKAGAPEGDVKDLPPVPKFIEGWKLGQPDLVLKMKEEFTVPASGRDLQHCFVIPIPIDEDKTVSAIEFRPGNPRIVHHAILYLDRSGMARKKDEADTGPGYSTFGGPGFLPTGGLGAWVPGADVRRLPEGTGKYLQKGSDLVFQIHYHPSGKEEKDQSSVGIYFTKKKAEKIVGGIGVRSRGIYIPPGEKNYKVTGQSDPLPCPVDVLSVGPHMHNIGRSMKAEAHLPDGKVIPLIWIKDWDFNWQGSYQYEKPVRLPKGAVVKIEAIYDNSTDNPRNPSNPPKFVRWGEQTTDEMCLFGLQVVTDTMEDLGKVMKMRNNRLGALLGSGPPRDILNKTDSKEEDFEFPSTPITIPDRGKALLKRFDKNGDGKLSKEEFESLPQILKDRVKDYLQQNGEPEKDK